MFFWLGAFGWLVEQRICGGHLDCLGHGCFQGAALGLGNCLCGCIEDLWIAAERHLHRLERRGVEPRSLDVHLLRAQLLGPVPECTVAPGRRGEAHGLITVLQRNMKKREVLAIAVVLLDRLAAGRGECRQAQLVGAMMHLDHLDGARVQLGRRERLPVSQGEDGLFRQIPASQTVCGSPYIGIVRPLDDRGDPAIVERPRDPLRGERIQRSHVGKDVGKKERKKGKRNNTGDTTCSKKTKIYFNFLHRRDNGLYPKHKGIPNLSDIPECRYLHRSCRGQLLEVWCIRSYRYHATPCWNIDLVFPGIHGCL